MITQFFCVKKLSKLVQNSKHENDLNLRAWRNVKEEI